MEKEVRNPTMGDPGKPLRIREVEDSPLQIPNTVPETMPQSVPQTAPAAPSPSREPVPA